MGYFDFLQQRIKGNVDDNDECISSRDVVGDLIVSDNAKSHMPTYKTTTPSPMKDDDDKGHQVQEQSPPPLSMCRRIDFLISLSNRGIKANKNNQVSSSSSSSTLLQRHGSGSTATHSDHYVDVATAVDDINITARKSVSERDIRSHRNSIHLYFNQRGGGGGSMMMSDRNVTTSSEAAATTRKRFKFITNSHHDSGSKEKTKSVSFFSLQLLKRNDNTPIQPVRLESDETKLYESSAIASTTTTTTVKGNNNNNNIVSFPSLSPTFLLGTNNNNDIMTDTAPKKPEREASILE